MRQHTPKAQENGIILDLESTTGVIAEILPQSKNDYSGMKNVYLSFYIPNSTFQFQRFQH
mgnify:CR=1 FL=1